MQIEHGTWPFKCAIYTMLTHSHIHYSHIYDTFSRIKSNWNTSQVRVCRILCLINVCNHQYGMFAQLISSNYVSQLLLHTCSLFGRELMIAIRRHVSMMVHMDIGLCEICEFINFLCDKYFFVRIRRKQYIRNKFHPSYFVPVSNQRMSFRIFRTQVDGRLPYNFFIDAGTFISS